MTKVLILAVKYNELVAGIITHLVLTDKVLNDFFLSRSKKEVFVGTGFPDIRYLKVIGREITHFEDLNFEDIKNTTGDFSAGLKFHSLVDEVRENYVDGQGLYGGLPKSKFISQAMKIYEDTVLHGKVSDWKHITQCFDDVLDSELAYGIDETSIRKWHKLIQDLTLSQTKTQIRYSLKTLGFDSDESEEIVSLINQLQDKTQYNTAIHDFYDNFESLLT